MIFDLHFKRHWYCVNCFLDHFSFLFYEKSFVLRQLFKLWDRSGSLIETFQSEQQNRLGYHERTLNTITISKSVLPLLASSISVLTNLAVSIKVLIFTSKYSKISFEVDNVRLTGGCDWSFVVFPALTETHATSSLSFLNFSCSSDCLFFSSEI